jgi:hypothetical protein
MKTWMYYAFAAALLAAPVGWITAGILAALENPLQSRAVHRSLYHDGNYAHAAIAAALIAISVTLLIGQARRSLRGSGRTSRFASN